MKSSTEYHHPPHHSSVQSGFVAMGLAALIIFLGSLIFAIPGYLLYVALLLITISIIGFSYGQYSHLPEGIKNNGIWFSSISSRGWLGWLTGIILTAFYCVLYWKAEWLGLHPNGNTGIIALFDSLSLFLKNQPASQWFVYGVFYTLAIVLFGIKFIWKYRHNRYQIFRTISLMFFQLIFAFLLPEFLLRMNLPYADLKNMWPLNYYFFDSWNLEALMNNGGIGWAILIFSLAMIFIISPLLTYFYGKRWYCSWVCGCGGLAETAGDSFRHLSDKSLAAWKIERYLIYSVLVFAVFMTIAVLYTYKTGQPELFSISSANLRSTYGFIIGAAFSGVIGVGFYPILGSRVWCRFGCPMAAILGIQQRFFSRFRITTNGGQCISCGNCSTYCEMGIDVRAYAQKGQNIVRASCVGCGICAAVCPRGVLKLENGSEDLMNRVADSNFIGKNSN